MTFDYIAAKRKAGIAARRALPLLEKKTLSAQICGHIASTTEFAQAQTIMLYRAVRSEVDLSLLMELSKDANKTLAYPDCTGMCEMVALAPHDDDAWRIGSYDIWAPMAERSRLIRPEDLDLIICPCTAFDAEGHRTGMGAGYYDRYLEKCTRAVFFAVAYEVQRQPYIEAQSWDIPMHAVVTERGIHYSAHIDCI